MSIIEMALILLIVIDPFGNLPVVLSVLQRLPLGAYRRAIVRELSIAVSLLLIFAIAGSTLLDYLNIQQSSLSVAGGVILFLISLRMIFSSAVHMYDDSYDDNPVIVPIAAPLIAGPSAITTVMILRTHESASLLQVMLALALVFALTAVIFWTGHWFQKLLGSRGMKALEKFMGLLLCLIAVNMTLVGIRGFWLETLPA